MLHTQVGNDREQGLDHSHGVLWMSLLEALLNTARSAIVGSGSDLYVWGANCGADLVRRNHPAAEPRFRPANIWCC